MPIGSKELPEPISRLAAMLNVDEGLQLRVYDDANGWPVVPGYRLIGHPTIGVGLALDTDGITLDEAAQLRDNRILKIRQSATSRFPWFAGLDSVRQDVIIAMIYNMGSQTFSEFRGLAAAMTAKDYEQAASQMLQSKWAAEVKSRAARMAEMMRSGQYPA